MRGKIPNPNPKIDKGTCFRERLGYIMERDGVTQLELAKAIHVNAQTIFRYVHMMSVPNIDTAIAIAKYFNVSLDWLCGLNDKEERD